MFDEKLPVGGRLRGSLDHRHDGVAGRHDALSEFKRQQGFANPATSTYVDWLPLSPFSSPLCGACAEDADPIPGQRAGRGPPCLGRLQHRPKL